MCYFFNAVLVLLGGSDLPVFKQLHDLKTFFFDFLQNNLKL